MTHWPINQAGVDLLERFEDFVGHAYPDPMSPLGKALQKRGLWRRVLAAPGGIPDDLRGLSGKPWTLGFGFTDGVQEGDTMSREEAEERLARELGELADQVRDMCRVRPNENQLAALVVCAFNIGAAGLRGSTMIRAHNRGDLEAASRAFRLWNKAGGQVADGLTRRREAEAALYRRPEDGEEFAEVMPQRVDPEKSLLRSPIIGGSILSGGGSALGLMSDASRTIGDMKYSLGDWLPWVLLALAIAGAAWAIYYRVKQRRHGWV